MTAGNFNWQPGYLAAGSARRGQSAHAASIYGGSARIPLGPCLSLSVTLSIGIT